MVSKWSGIRLTSKRATETLTTRYNSKTRSLEVTSGKGAKMIRARSQASPSMSSTKLLMLIKSRRLTCSSSMACI